MSIVTWRRRSLLALSIRQSLEFFKGHVVSGIVVVIIKRKGKAARGLREQVVVKKRCLGSI